LKPWQKVTTLPGLVRPVFLIHSKDSILYWNRAYSDITDSLSPSITENLPIWIL